MLKPIPFQILKTLRLGAVRKWLVWLALFAAFLPMVAAATLFCWAAGNEDAFDVEARWTAPDFEDGGQW